MPRITKSDLELAIAQRPFAPEHAADAPEAWGNLPEAMQRAVASAIGRDKAAGLSGHDLRVRYGGDSRSNGAERDSGLTGPMRRKVLRQFGLDSPATIARSYAQYTDGEPRVGSAHAKNHGALAAERQAEAIRQAEADAEREAKRAERAAKRAAAKAAKAA
jgi:hypothetical protein